KKAQFPLSGPWEKVYRSKDGKNIDVEVDCKFIDAANETVLAVYIRNISRRKRIEREVTELNKRLEERVEERTQQLAESNEKLRNEMRERLAAEQHASQQRAFLDHVVEKLPLGIYVTEAEKNCRISVWNAEMERLFGNSKDTVVGKRIDEIFADPHLAKVLGDQRKQDVHSRTIAPPSNSKGNSIQSFVADIARTPIFDAKGKRVGLVGVLQDVSERIDSENRLVAAFRELELSKSKLEQSNLEIRQGIEKAKKLAIAAQDSNRAKSFFMSNISHELRTPLNSILGLTSVLLEKTFGDLTHKQGEFLQIIDDSSRHLQSLITDILDLSKIELGKLKLQYSPISPKELGDTTLKMVKQAKDQKPLEYQLKCPSRLPEIEADPRRLRQILLNLLGNAAKFAAEDTTITLSIKVAEDGERITFSVKDRGIGIRNADLRKLFKPFVQIDDSLSRSHEGTGLGLAIVHKLVELHGGSVYVESQPHKGSVFSFSIPTRRTTQDIDNQLKLSDVYDAAPHRQVALVIDENEASAQHACRILKKNGYAHPVVTYPNEVSAHYEHLSPHLVLIDIQTLRNQGSDWIAAARNHPNWEKTAWLATSSLNTQPDLSYCEQLGLHIFTPKPLTPNNLRILNP
ncbi:MAG: ATP-binding protein, partial [Verrucomicrobiota bacterium]